MLTKVNFPPPRLKRQGEVLLLCLVISGCGSALVTDTEYAGSNQPRIQKLLTNSADIRKLIRLSETQLIRDQNDKLANSKYEDALLSWETTPNANVFGFYDDFDKYVVKLFDAYIEYLIESKKPALAIVVLRRAILEADKARSYQWSSALRTQLADLLVSIGQIEIAQNSLDESQAISDKVYGHLTANTENVDPYQLADNASIISARIRIGGTINQVRLLAIARSYKKSIESNSISKFITPLSDYTSIKNDGVKINDHDYYRRDQEYWRWFAIGAIRVGDTNLARSSVEQMLSSAGAASDSRFASITQLHGDFAVYAKLNMQNFYLNQKSLKYKKSADVAFAFETDFDFNLAGAEIYLMLNEPAIAEKLIAKAKHTLINLNSFSAELQKLGHSGLKIEQRTGELQRITAKLYIKNKRWNDALAQLDQYIAWSEVYRNSLSLEERLPYFRGKSQGAYLDAVLARASLFQSAPSEANFNHALEALGNMKARQLRDALEAGGISSKTHEVFAKKNIDLILKSGKAYLSIADAGEDLVVFFADNNDRKIRIIRKPKDFAKSILSLRNKLAEQQIFDSAGAQVITSLVLGGLESKVFEKKSLIVETDGSLSYLPVELWMNSKMISLGKNTVVSYIPTLAMADVSRAASTAKGILAVGDAQFDQKQQINAIGAEKEYALRGKKRDSDFAPLPETRDEINSIIRNVKEGGKSMFGKNATKSEFFREARSTQYRYLHFATHGVVGGEIPRLNEPALVLTPENNDSGFLTATEIGKMKISADLVVLSACNSGNGEYFSGEGLMGLGRAFILAGAKAVVVSLWPVDSQTTKDMMIKFYRDLEITGDPSLALANARQAVMNDKTHSSNAQRALKKIGGNVPTAKEFTGRENPFFWAPFILVESGL